MCTRRLVRTYVLGCIWGGMEENLGRESRVFVTLPEQRDHRSSSSRSLWSPRGSLRLNKREQHYCLMQPNDSLLWGNIDSPLRKPRFPHSEEFIPSFHSEARPAHCPTTWLYAENYCSLEAFIVQPPHTHGLLINWSLPFRIVSVSNINLHSITAYQWYYANRHIYILHGVPL